MATLSTERLTLPATDEEWIMLADELEDLAMLIHRAIDDETTSRMKLGLEKSTGLARIWRGMDQDADKRKPRRRDAGKRYRNG